MVGNENVNTSIDPIYNPAVQQTMELDTSLGSAC
jgi:hypothetical protein